MDELAKVGVMGNEVGLAAYLNQNAELTVRVEVAFHQPLMSGSLADFFGGLNRAFLAQDFNCPLKVAVGLGQRRPAVSHAGAGEVSQLG